MTSSASATAVNGDIVPIEASPPPGGTTFINAGVDAKSYDLEWAKTIPLGGCCDSSCCGETCQTGCSGCCRPCCPAWDITWSGGFRWGDVTWDRNFNAEDANAFTVTDGRADMSFRGGGLRTGLEGRRYFGKNGWFSLYGKGNISLLLGDVDLTVRRITNDPSVQNNPVTDATQTFTTRQIIPVTELEAGVTGQVTCHTSITAGYLYAAWHDLGFRDEDQLNTILPVRVRRCQHSRLRRLLCPRRIRVLTIDCIFEGSASARCRPFFCALFGFKDKRFTTETRRAQRRDR